VTGAEKGREGGWSGSEMMMQPKSKGDESLLGTPELAGVLSLNRSPRGDALPEISKVAMLFREDDGTGKGESDELCHL